MPLRSCASKDWPYESGNTPKRIKTPGKAPAHSDRDRRIVTLAAKLIVIYFFRQG
jgi:hypothetical protein